MQLVHSAKGTTWKNHKYIAIKNGRYIYPKPEGSSKRSSKTMRDITTKAPEVVRSTIRGEPVLGIEINRVKEQITQRYGSLKNGIDKFENFADDLIRKAAAKRNANELAQTGQMYINNLLKKDFKSSTLIDLEGRGVRIELYTDGEKIRITK